LEQSDQPDSIEQSAADPDAIVNHDFDSDPGELTVTIVDAVSEALDISPTEIVPRVSDHVDPDALDRLFRPAPDGGTRRGRLVLELQGCHVEIVGDGTIFVYSGE
jgi:hypothetical protein